MLTDLHPENRKDYLWYTGYSAQNAIDSGACRGGWASILSFATDWQRFHRLNEPVLLNEEDIVEQWLRETGTDIYICPRDQHPATPANLIRL